jgi:hypothetical protein
LPQTCKTHAWGSFAGALGGSRHPERDYPLDSRKNLIYNGFDARVAFRSQKKWNAGPTGVENDAMKQASERAHTVIDEEPSNIRLLKVGIHKLRAPASPRLMSADRLAEHVHDLARNATGAAAGEE